MISCFHYKEKMDSKIISCEDYDYRPPMSENINTQGGEFSICVNNEDITTHPHKSRLVINGKVTVTQLVKNKDGVQERVPRAEIDKTIITMVNNGALTLFDRIDYYVGDCKIESVRKPFFCSTMKGLASFEHDKKYNDGGWKIELPGSTVINSAGYFSLTIHLSTVMGFFEDYIKFLYRTPQKLVFHRAVTSNDNMFLDTNKDDNITLDLKDVIWRMPQVKFSIEYEAKIRKEILGGKSFEMLYRHWMYQSIPIPHGSEFTWEIPTSYSRIKYVLLAFQSRAKENKLSENNATFDLFNLENVQILLNNHAYYPRERLNLKSSENKVGRLYYMYKMFKASYYARNENEIEPLVDYNTFVEKFPIIAIDCSLQESVIKDSLINLKILFNWRETIADNSAIIHAVMIMDDKAVYTPLHNTVVHNTG